MIPQNRLFQLCVFLMFALLTACEPLAPQQTPQVIVVTGVTRDAPALADAGAGGGALVSAGTATPERAGGVVSTPIPTSTATPIPTALPSATPFGCGETAGQIVEDTFTSTIVGGEVPYTMYLPPCFYETWQRYPYVILLHGTGYDEQMWLDLEVASAMDKGIKNGSLPPMVLVMPDGGTLSEMNDQPEGESYENVIVDELIPALENYQSGYCLWGSRDGRAIGGISRGGFWAFSIAFRDPELFSAVGGHSPHFEPDNAGPETNPLDLAERVSLSKTPLGIWLDNATQDYVNAYVEVMSETLQARGIDHEYTTYPSGGHDVAYWAAHVPEYLAFYGRAWPLDVTELPSCEEPSPE